MAKLRKGVSYRRVERPYTRKSKYRAKNYVRANPHNLVVKYDMGDTKREFPVRILLVSRESIQLRHNALEAARKTCNRALESKLGKSGYRFKLRVFPHHVLRENPLASGAGADRMSTGMAFSFGKPIGIAAQVRQGHPIIEIGVEKKDVPTARIAAQRANFKFPCTTRIVVEQNPHADRA